MSVLLEAVSILIRIGGIKKRYPGGMEQFEKDFNGGTFCKDSKLVRIGFMSSNQADRFLVELMQKGLIYKENNKTVDMVFGTQTSGLEDECDWIELREFPVENDGLKGFVVAANLSWSLYDNNDENLKKDRENLSLPSGWRYSISLSKDFYLS
ncbi:MAG: hypothetical protein ACM3N1_00135 [Accumulibacter sp.]